MASALALPSTSVEWNALPASALLPRAAPGDQVDDVPEAVRTARQTIVQGEAEIATLAVAAKTLLDFKDFDTLRAVLAGSHDKAVHGLLRSLTAQPPASYEVLMPDILALIGLTAVPAVRREADAALGRLASRRPDMLQQLKVWLGDETVVGARRVAVITALGASRNIGVVEPLIRELDGPHAAAAGAALVTVTRHARGADQLGAYWRAYWEERRHLTREQLLDREILELWDLNASTEAKLIADNIALKLDAIGTEVDRLVEGLSDGYPEVRMAAARRLGQHLDKVRAASAVPAILRGLGHPANGNGHGVGTTNGSQNGGANGKADPEADIERDPTVRAELVTTLGLLGRAGDGQGGVRADVRTALVAELESVEAVVAAAAAGALQMLRNESDVVLPLLAYLERTPGEEIAANVLTAIARNRPKGVITRLVPWTDLSLPSRVRAAAVRAIMASDDAKLALDKLEQVYVADESREVRFAMAHALGDRARNLPTDAPVRAPLVALLGSLLQDVETTVRVEAAAALGKTGMETALNLLEGWAGVETDPAVLGRMIEALGALHFLEGGRLIGQITAGSESAQDEFEALARSSLALIGEQRGPADWLSLAQGLTDAEAPSLAAWCLGELIRSFEAEIEHHDAVQLARGRLPVALFAAGDVGRAHALLLELEAGGAPHPTPTDRLELLARTSEALGQISDSADFLLRLYALLPEGEMGRDATARAAIDALMRSKRYVDALPYLREIVRENPSDNHLLYDLAHAEEKLGQYDQAGIHLNSLKDRVPADDIEFHGLIDTALARITQVLKGAAVADDDEPKTP